MSSTINETIYLLEVEAYDPALPGVRTLRYSTGQGYVTSPAATPANTHFPPRLMESVAFRVSAFSDGRVMGGTSVGTGTISLANADEVLSPLLDYGFDGRPLTVWIGKQDAAFPGGFTRFFSGTVEQAVAEDDAIVLRIRDQLQILRQPFSEVRYAGTNVLPNGVEGTADDIANQVKPHTYGRCYEVPGVLVNSALQIWQVHNGAVQAIDAVYDRGIAYTFGTNHANLAALQAATVTEGTYHTCLSLGLYRLGVTPIGPVTADVRGDNSGGYVNRVGAIVQRMLVNQCGVSLSDIDTATFTTLDALAPYEVGIHVSGEQTRLSVIDQLLVSVGAWLVPTRLGTWTIGRLVAPTGTAAATFTSDQIYKLTKRPTGDDARGVPIKQVVLRYRKNWQQFRAADISGAVSSERKLILENEWRTTTADDPSVVVKHLQAEKLERDCLFVNKADADAEAARLLALHGVRRDLLDGELAPVASAVALEIGTVVTLATSLLGYDAGRKVVVVGLQTDGGGTEKITPQFWG